MENNAVPSGQSTQEETHETLNNDNPSMEDLLAEENLSFQLPHPGEVRQGVIASINDSEILVSIGAKSEGIISSKELEQLDEEARESIFVGNEIPVFIITLEDKSGNMQLSYARALEEADWSLAEALQQSDEIFEGIINGYNKGGLIVQFGRLRGFVPASQVSISRRLSASGNTPEQRWGSMVNQPIVVKVIEVNRERRRLIFSERAASNESRESIKDRIISELNVGDVCTGRVTSLADFGAFVNIMGADGLVHLSELSWDRVKHPSEVLKVGQEVEVKVISLDRERKRIGLSIRQLQKDPWYDQIASLRVGQLVEGTITRLTKFGAFARLAGDIEGLIHISEISDQHIEHPREVLKVGDVVTLRVIKVDPDNRRIGLSIRKVDTLGYADLDWQLALEEADLEDFLLEESEEIEEEELLQESPPEAFPQGEEPAAEEPVQEVISEEVAPPAEAQPEEPPQEDETTTEETVQEVISEEAAPPAEAQPEEPPQEEEPATEEIVQEVISEEAASPGEAQPEENPEQS